MSPNIVSRKICTVPICIHTGELQNLSNFSKDKNKKDGYSSNCKDCDKQYYINNQEQRKEYSRDFYKNNREKVIKSRKRSKDKNKKTYRKRVLINKYNLSEELAQKYLNEEMICEVCGSCEKVVVDHCHTTGIYRGSLCQRCNISLGNMKENSENIENLKIYAEKCQEIRERKSICCVLQLHLFPME